MIEYAKKYTSLNWQVFPLRPHDKIPLIATAHPEGDPLYRVCKGGCGKDGHGFGDATLDASKIAEWWTKTPAANIGIATGARSGIVVLDVDAGHGGEETLTALLKEHGPLPKTVIAHTGGGGRHFLFAYPGIEISNSAGRLGKGLDIRADGGYIAAPPSIHPNGTTYKWDAENKPSTTPLAQMPIWLLKLVIRREPEQPQQQATPQGDAIPAGGRNQALISLAGTMRRRGMSEAAIYAALQNENRLKCTPPLSDNEVRQIAKSAGGYQPSAPVATANAERANMEWAFAKVMFDIPEAAQDFLWLEPEQISDPSLSNFWSLLLSGQPPLRAAESAHIIGDIEKVVSNADLVDVYARGITRHDYLSGLAKMGRDIEYLARQGDTERLQATIEALAESKPQSPAVEVSGASDGLDELVESMKAGRNFIKTGLGSFDAITGGLEKKTMSILAARPSMGKTTVAWQMARTIALSGKRVLFLSLEVSQVSLWRKAAFGLAEISNADFENDKIPLATIDRVIQEIIPNLKKELDGKLFIYDTPPFTTSALEKAIVQISPDVVILDHLDYVECEADNQVSRLGKITKWAKRTCKKKNHPCHFMILHQLNRDVEKRERKEPQLADLRDSGHVEQDADMVIMPYRPSYYADNSFELRYHETMLYIRKNRDGRLGVVGLYMDMLHQWFYRRDEIRSDYANTRMPKGA